MTTSTFDIIIIGTGAGGGTLAYQLASSGKKILILERGGFLPREVENWNPHEVYTKGRYRAAEKWLDATGAAFDPFTHYCVGGNTKMYGSALLRLRERDFAATEHIDGISPEWPLTYNDLEPYYTQAEHLYSVHGERGIDPTDPPASRPYPYAATPAEPDMAQLKADMQSRGLRPAPIPIGVRLAEDSARPEAKIELNLFDGYPDPTEAKADAHVVALKAALQHPNVTLLTGRKALRLLTDASGKRVTDVVVEHEGMEETYRGETVVVSCGAINSAALLLRSANAQHPNGLANSSGLVGRHLMLHNNGCVVAFWERRNEALFQKSIILADYYHQAPDWKYPLGSIQMMGKTDPDTLRGEVEDLVKEGVAIPGLNGRAAADTDIEWFARHSVDFFITTEDLPMVHNQVALHNGSIQLRYTPNNLEAYGRLREKLVGIMDGIAETYGYDRPAYGGFKLGISGVSHQSGTCRFGHDPHTSVLDLHCKAHDLDNLYVVDTSFFPSSGAVNPALTAMANALRVGEMM